MRQVLADRHQLTSPDHLLPKYLAVCAVRTSENANHPRAETLKLGCEFRLGVDHCLGLQFTPTCTLHVS
jgi:hypothetical protein